MADNIQHLHSVWANMKSRCNNPNVRSYKHYKNIKVCDAWQTFAGFLADMGKSYQDGLTLERIDNKGDYVRSNCRWATPKDQANNRRTNRFINYQGKTLTVAQWADELGIKYSTFKQRFYVYKWPPERLIGGYIG